MSILNLVCSFIPHSHTIQFVVWLIAICDLWRNRTDTGDSISSSLLFLLTAVAVKDNVELEDTTTAKRMKEPSVQWLLHCCPHQLLL